MKRRKRKKEKVWEKEITSSRLNHYTVVTLAIIKSRRLINHYTIVTLAIIKSRRLYHYTRVTLAIIKGIVSPDWGELQMLPMESLEVF